MFVEEPPFVAATFQFCIRHGLKVPEDLSLICTDHDPGFQWYKPAVTHIQWDSRPMVRRIVRWAANLWEGKDDRQKGSFQAKLIEGGTIGPARQNPRGLPPA